MVISAGCVARNMQFFVFFETTPRKEGRINFCLSGSFYTADVAGLIICTDCMCTEGLQKNAN